jgi:hypothetical protein
MAARWSCHVPVSSLFLTFSGLSRHEIPLFVFFTTINPRFVPSFISSALHGLIDRNSGRGRLVFEVSKRVSICPSVRLEIGIAALL